MSSPFADPIFQPGDKVTPVYVSGYVLTMGNVYTVQRYEPRYFDGSVPAGYTWPAYVHVQDDWGRDVVAHASRFRLA